MKSCVANLSWLHRVDLVLFSHREVSTILKLLGVGCCNCCSHASTATSRSESVLAQVKKYVVLVLVDEGELAEHETLQCIESMCAWRIMIALAQLDVVSSASV